MHVVRFVGVVWMLGVLCLACKEEIPSFKLGEPFSLAFDQKASIPSEGITVHFAEIGGDSRCPTNVACLTAGEVSVVIRISKGSEAIESLTLSLPGSTRAPASEVVNNLRYKLLEVNPYPEYPGVIPDSAYEIELLIEKI